MLKVDDEYYTPKGAWADVSDYIPKNKTIWECFYSPRSKSADYLRELGCTNVISEDCDFYTSNHGDVIVTNPPFHQKEKLMERLKELDKPFILIFPIHSIRIHCVRQNFGGKVQFIIPRRRIHFEKYNDEKHVLERKNQNSFDCLYMCYKLNLNKDIIWL